MSVTAKAIVVEALDPKEFMLTHSAASELERLGFERSEQLESGVDFNEVWVKVVGDLRVEVFLKDGIPESINVSYPRATRGLPDDSSLMYAEAAESNFAAQIDRMVKQARTSARYAVAKLGLMGHKDYWWRSDVVGVRFIRGKSANIELAKIKWFPQQRAAALVRDILRVYAKHGVVQ